MGTLAQQIVSDATTVFLNTDDFAQTVTHYTYNGSSFTSTSRTANFDEFGGAVEDTQIGRRFVRRAIIDLPATVTVVCNDDQAKCDYFTVSGERWDVESVPERDAGMVSVQVVRYEKVATRKGRD